MTMRSIIKGMVDAYGDGYSISVRCVGRKNWHLHASDHKSFGPCTCILRALRRGWPDYTFNMSGKD